MTGELVRALCSCVGDRRRGRARRFLRGLSADELQYIADFLGSRILESNHRRECRISALEEDIANFERCRSAAVRNRSGCRRLPAVLQDQDHKMILLLEYIQRCGFEQTIDHAARA